MRILVAAGSFKDALAATNVCAAIAEGLRRRTSPPINPPEIIEFPLADGGDGMLDVLARHLRLNILPMATVDPLLRPLSAPMGISADGALAVIEMAKVSGLNLLSNKERNPMCTSTVGTGILISAARDRGVQKIILGIGGSATNDLGIGMATALGWRFLDKQEVDVLPMGDELRKVRHIVPADVADNLQIEVLCDVTNPLLGEQGAARVYAKQKGANEAEIQLLESGAQHFVECAQQVNSSAPFLAQTAGAGAAGGLGFGALLFLRATLHRGVETILDLTAFDRALNDVQLVVTGEGRLDGQTLHGKLIHGICARAARRNIPTIALTGQLTATAAQLKQIGLSAAYEIDRRSRSLTEQLAATYENLAATAATIPLAT